MSSSYMRLNLHVPSGPIVVDKCCFCKIIFDPHMIKEIIKLSMYKGKDIAHDVKTNSNLVLSGY